MEKEEVIKAIEDVRKFNTETNTIETKSAFIDFPKKCYDTFSSFSNKYGGFIIFGISEKDNFSTEGVYDIRDLQRRVTAMCNDAMEPAIRCDLLPMEFENKEILAVKIDELQQNKKPCYYKPKGLKSGSYTREGDRDDLMTDYEIYAHQSYNDHIIEDIRPCKRASINDLDKDSINNYLERIKDNKPNFSQYTYEQQLKLCGIVDNMDDNVVPTLSGIMIFGKYPQGYYPQLFVACSVIPGENIGDVGYDGERFLDNKRIEGTIEEMLNGTMTFIRRNMKEKVIIDSYGKRINKTEYPIEALREAVANALIHRDYSSQTENAYISVYMYSDRIEIISPGALYGANKLEKLGSAVVMEARNPTIVRIFEDKGSIIENRHSGIPTMKREMHNYGLPYPEFYEEIGSFKVVFRNSNTNSSGQQIDLGEHKLILREHKLTLGGTQIDLEGTQIDLEGTQIDLEGTQIDLRGTQIDLEGTQIDLEGSQIDVGGTQISKPIDITKELDDNEILFLKTTVLIYCETPKSLNEIARLLNIKSKKKLLFNIIKPLLLGGKLEYTNKNSVNARNQKYKTVNK